MKAHGGEVPGARAKSQRRRRGPARSLGCAFALSSFAIAQGTPPASTRVEIVLRGEAAEGSVGFGAHFELDVVRRWPKGEVAEPFAASLLAPLVVDELEVRTNERDGEVVETRRCRARAFQRGAVTLLPKSEAARTLLVDSCLPEGDAGVLELPALPPLEIRAGRRALGLVVAVAVATFALSWIGVVLLRADRRRRSRVPLRVRLARELEALVAAAPISEAERRADAVAATRILRSAEQRLGSANRGADAEAMTAADRLLDDVKFAGRALEGPERARVLATLRAAIDALPEDAA